MKDVERYIVAIAALGASIEAEAKALAADLGTTAYEERLKLASGLPAVVLATADGEAAQALLAKLRARGDRAQLCRASEVVPASAMVRLRQFQLEEDALDTGDARLVWAEISAFVRARHHRLVESTETVKHKKFAIGRAIATGGLVMRKSENREVVTRSEDFEQVLYIFRANGGTPWILREHGTNYGGLGASLTPTAIQNFALAVQQFRARASHARFDDSLLRRPAITEVDLYAHLLAVAP
jgi:hypothetical protein